MHPSLIRFISNNAPLLASIFESRFQTHTGWFSYLHERLGAGGVSGLLTKLSFVYGSPPDFQALYVACWIHRPVEKGSYMIPLTGSQGRGAEQAFDRLPTRWSSHLSGEARSAGEGYSFLKGYSELLVQIEVDKGSDTPHLFLKTEGHGAMSLAHLSSFFTKLKTGQGNTQSEALHNMAAMGHLGIEPRAAENYSKTYEAVLKNIKLAGKRVTAEEAVIGICEKLETKATLVNPGLWAQVKARRATPNFRPSGLQLADLIEQVIVPTITRDNVRVGQHVAALQTAKSDLASLARNLRRDAQSPSPPMARVFEEVRVTQDELDRSLAAFKLDLLTAVRNR